MGPARPGGPDLRPHPRNDLTVPDLYGQAVIGRGPRPLDPPATDDSDEAPKGPSGRRRRQLGSDRRATRAMPMVPKPVSETRIAMGRLALIVTVAAWIGYVINWFFSDFFHPGFEGAVARTEEILYLLIVTLLTVSALAYLLTRLGFMYRTRTHHRATRASLDQYYDARRPTLTTIIPSYQEEERVIMTTLLSAALQEYPDKRVVLLIDDPLRAQERAGPQAARAGAGPAGKAERLLSEPARRFGGEMQVVRDRDGARRAAHAELDGRAGRHLRGGGQLAAEPGRTGRRSSTTPTSSSSTRSCCGSRSPSTRCAPRCSTRAAEGVVLHAQMFRRLYRRLVWTFGVRA